MTTASKQSGQKIDAMMEHASIALVQRDYFLAEQLAFECLRSAILAKDYQRAARVINPLQEARRMKRDLAVDAGRVVLISEPIGEQFVPEPGCYFFVPPRVGQEARVLRVRAEQACVPVIVIAREPRTSGGLCPVVSVGPVTARAYVQEPTPPPTSTKGKGNKQTKATTPKQASTATLTAPPAQIVNVFGTFITPDMPWILAACEALGDAAIEQVTSINCFQRVEALYLRLQAFPDHEKLHQRLRQACEESAHQALINPVGARTATKLPGPGDDEQDN